MKITVMGAGSVGCYFGGMLAPAGHDVTLIAQLPFGQLLEGEGALAVMCDVVEECLAVAGAADIRVPGDP